MDIQTYRINREKIPVEQLRRYDGQWVAFSTDGARIVAGAADLDTLDGLVRAAGEDPERVGYERIVLNDTWQGGGIEFE
jgi:hypothetical protein